MTGRYAPNTHVPVLQSLKEIEVLIVRFGGTGFDHKHRRGVSTIEFEIASRRVRFSMPTDPRKHRTDQGELSNWRALHLSIKGRLASVESGIETFEQSFFAHIVHPATGKTVYEMAKEPLALAYEKGENPPLMSDKDDEEPKP
jgi:hypothetical protein